MEIQKLLDIFRVSRRLVGGAGGGERPGEEGVPGPEEQAHQDRAGVEGVGGGHNEGSGYHFWGACVL